MSSNFGLANANNLSPYELERMENIVSVKNQLGGVLVNLSSVKTTINSNVQEKKSRRVIKKKSRVEFVRRSARIRHETNKSNYNEESDSDNDEVKPMKKFRQGSLIIKFPWAKNKENEAKDKIFYNGLSDSDFISDDEVEYYENTPVRQRQSNKAPVQLPASKITPEMIENVYYSSSGKQYSKEGTTCHQCRQKTLDQKSYCRHKGCRGVRGMFCGFCLGNRYGENVAEVLLLKKWACPPCRGYCNCSICRRRIGKPPTGQLAQIAHSQGFKSVRHLLVEVEGENPTSLTSDDDEEKDNVSTNDDEEKEDISTNDKGEKEKISTNVDEEKEKISTNDEKKENISISDDDEEENISASDDGDKENMSASDDDDEENMSASDDEENMSVSDDEENMSASDDDEENISASDADEEKENIAGVCETKSEDIFISHEKSNIEIDDNVHSESMSDSNVHFGSESKSDNDVYFEEYVKFDSFL